MTDPQQPDGAWLGLIGQALRADLEELADLRVRTGVANAQLAELGGKLDQIAEMISPMVRETRVDDGKDHSWKAPDPVELVREFVAQRRSSSAPAPLARLGCDEVEHDRPAAYGAEHLADHWEVIGRSLVHAIADPFRALNEHGRQMPTVPSETKRFGDCLVRRWGQVAQKIRDQRARVDRPAAWPADRKMLPRHLEMCAGHINDDIGRHVDIGPHVDLVSVLYSPSSSASWWSGRLPARTRLQACWTELWSFPPKRMPISGKDSRSRVRVKYMAIARGPETSG